jgi:hypothetical protein
VLGDHDGDGAGIEGFEDVRDIARGRAEHDVLDHARHVRVRPARGAGFR